MMVVEMDDELFGVTVTITDDDGEDDDDEDVASDGDGEDDDDVEDDVMVGFERVVVEVHRPLPCASHWAVADEDDDVVGLFVLEVDRLLPCSSHVAAATDEDDDVAMCLRVGEVDRLLALTLR